MNVFRTAWLRATWSLNQTTCAKAEKFLAIFGEKYPNLSESDLTEEMDGFEDKFKCTISYNQCHFLASRFEATHWQGDRWDNQPV